MFKTWLDLLIRTSHEINLYVCKGDKINEINLLTVFCLILTIMWAHVGYFLMENKKAMLLLICLSKKKENVCRVVE